MKKLRRKRIRQRAAVLREKDIGAVFPSDLDESEALEQPDSDEEEQSQLRHQQWLQAEKEAQRM